MIKNWDKTAFCKLQQFLGHKYFQKSLFNLAQNDKNVINVKKKVASF